MGKYDGLQVIKPNERIIGTVIEVVAPNEIRISEYFVDEHGIYLRNVQKDVLIDSKNEIMRLGKSLHQRCHNLKKTYTKLRYITPEAIEKLSH